MQGKNQSWTQPIIILGQGWYEKCFQNPKNPKAGRTKPGYVQKSITDQQTKSPSKFQLPNQSFKKKKKLLASLSLSPLVLEYDLFNSSQGQCNPLPGYLHILQHTPRLWWAYYYYYYHLCCIGLSAIHNKVCCSGWWKNGTCKIYHQQQKPLFPSLLSLSLKSASLLLSSVIFINCVQISLSLSLPSFFGLTTFSWFQQTMQTPCEVWPQFFTTCSEMICRERERERERERDSRVLESLEPKCA